MRMNIIKILGSRVLVKLIEAAPAEDSGIQVAAESLNPSYFQGEVIAIGSVLQNTSPLLVKPGDKVAFLKYGCEDMGENLYIVEENSILCTYE